MPEELKKTPLYPLHIDLHARMVPFAGWDMPLQYSGIIDEHRAVRTSAGIFDVSHMGRIEVSGKGALDTIQHITTNDIIKLYPGRIQYTLLCNEGGGVIDDVTLYMIENDRFLFCVNAINMEKDLNWIQEKATDNVVVYDKTHLLSQLAIQGPKAREILQRLCDEDLSSIKYYHFRSLPLCGREAIVSRTGYTGEDGFEVYAPSSTIPLLWKRLFEEGKDYGIKPCGLGSRDILRLEVGYCLYGHELSESINPLEADLGWIVKLDKGDFIGRDALVEARNKGVERILIGFEMIEQSVPRQGYAITIEDEKVGEVTSGTFSPALKKAIGMGYIARDNGIIGKEIYIDVRGRKRKALIVKRPFIIRGKNGL